MWARKRVVKRINIQLPATMMFLPAKLMFQKNHEVCVSENDSVSYASRSVNRLMDVDLLQGDCCLLFLESVNSIIRSINSSPIGAKSSTFANSHVLRALHNKKNFAALSPPSELQFQSRQATGSFSRLKTVKTRRKMILSVYFSFSRAIKLHDSLELKGLGATSTVESEARGKNGSIC